MVIISQCNCMSIEECFSNRRITDVNVKQQEWWVLIVWKTKDAWQLINFNIFMSSCFESVQIYYDLGFVTVIYLKNVVLLVGLLIKRQ